MASTRTRPARLKRACAGVGVCTSDYSQLRFENVRRPIYPLDGINARLFELGATRVAVRALVRSGDTPAKTRAAMAKVPPHILVTTPESLYLLLTSVSGRLAGKQLPQGFEVETRELQFATEAGQHWPGGNIALAWEPAAGSTPTRGRLRADQLDLQALAGLADRLPIDEPQRRQLAQCWGQSHQGPRRTRRGHPAGVHRVYRSPAYAIPDAAAPWLLHQLK